MLKNDMQHQFWVTKKTVQRKLGLKKEDQCVVSSDSELDLKIELFESVSQTCSSLFRVLDLYQERVSLLAQEETQLGRLLKEHGKQIQPGGGKRTMTAAGTAGKAISYCGQQRMALRGPLIRLHSELETFRSRAISDTLATIREMERERTEYRASLSWMKSITLDPEDDRGLEKFRKAQQTVRSSKERFDKRGLDCLEKIDLLAAARCNMFSHVLVAYQTAMTTFAHKTYETFKVASKILENEPHYSFSILRDLTQAESQPKASAPQEEDQGGADSVKEFRENAVDSDQLLFFQEDYTDAEKEETQRKGSEAQRDDQPKPDELISVDQDSAIPVPPASQQGSSIMDALGGEAESLFLNQPDSTLLDLDLLGTSDLGAQESALNESSTIDPLLDLLGDGPAAGAPPPPPTTGSKSVLAMLSNKLAKGTAANSMEKNSSKAKNGKDMSSWFKLFSELDPLANPDHMSKQIETSHNSHST